MDFNSQSHNCSNSHSHNRPISQILNNPNSQRPSMYPRVQVIPLRILSPRVSRSNPSPRVHYTSKRAQVRRLCRTRTFVNFTNSSLYTFNCSNSAFLTVQQLYDHPVVHSIDDVCPNDDVRVGGPNVTSA